MLVMGKCGWRKKKFRRSERSFFPWHHLALLKSQRRERERERVYIDTIIIDYCFTNTYIDLCYTYHAQNLPPHGVTLFVYLSPIHLVMSPAHVGHIKKEKKLVCPQKI